MQCGVHHPSVQKVGEPPTSKVVERHLEIVESRGSDPEVPAIVPEKVLGPGDQALWLKISCPIPRSSYGDRTKSRRHCWSD